MEILGTIMQWIGGIIWFVGGIWMLIEVFKSGILWFIGCLFISPLSLLWLILHWEDGKSPFFLQLGGGAICIVGVFMLGQ